MIIDKKGDNVANTEPLNELDFKWEEATKTVRLKLDDYLKKAEAENIYLKKVDHDLSDYITEANADAKYVTKTTGATHLTKTAATAKYLSKADAMTTYLSKADANNDYYTKSEITTSYYTKTDADALFETKTKVDTDFLKKADATRTYLSKADANTNHYTKTQADAKYELKTEGATHLKKADATRTYLTKTQARTDHYTKTEINTNHYTKTQSDARFMDQTVADNRFVAQNEPPIIMVNFNESGSYYSFTGRPNVDVEYALPRVRTGYTVKAWHCYIRDGANNRYNFIIDNVFTKEQYNTTDSAVSRQNSKFTFLKNGTKNLHVPNVGLKFVGNQPSTIKINMPVDGNSTVADTYHLGGYYVATRN